MTTTSPITFTDSMRALLHPKSVAIIGDSPNPGFAPIIRRNIVTCGYEGGIYPINPKYDEIAGLTAYPSVEAVPGGVDLAIIGVPVRAVDAVLEQCERAGVKAINIITSGYGEQDDELAHQRQDHLRQFAKRTGIRIVGPNCLGNISVPAQMCGMSGAFEFLKPGPVGLVLQSGLLAYSLVTPPMDRDMGFSYIVTTGNEADLEAADLMRYYVEDDETRVIGAFIEQFRDPEKLIQVAEMAAEKEKPIVVLKIGRSEAGKRSAQAHTGSLVGSDEVSDAVMRQYGIVRVNGLDEMTETLAAFYTDRLPSGPGVGAIYVSGGAAGLVSDLSADLELELPDLAPHTIERLEAVIPEYGTVGNPLDTTGMAGAIPELMQGAIEGMAEDPSIHTVIYGQAYPTTVDLDTPPGEVMRNAHAKYPDKVFLAISLVPGQIAIQNRRDGGPPHEPVTNWGGVPFLQGVENGLRAVKHLNDYATYLRNRSPNGRVAGDSAVAQMARELVQASAGKPLVERTAKHVLSLYGIPTTTEHLATSPNAAVSAANKIGYPVVLKIESPDITHKTDAGGVLLNLTDDDAVRSGFDQIIASARAYNPDADIAGVLVGQMAPSGGREMIVGMTRDPDFGPAVAVGLGGIFVEVLKDVTLGVPPLSEMAARDMLGRLRGKAILDGTRGQGPADADAVVDILLRFSQLCLDLRDDVVEIDINPLLVYEEGALVVDCLVVPG